MYLRPLAVGLAMASLAGCANMFPPSAEKLAALPVVTFPDKPPAGDFIFLLPGGKPIPSRVAITGTALATGAEQTLTVTLPRDLYVHRRWVSEDGKTWKPLGEVLAVELALSLPSDEHPAPGEMVLRIDRKDGR